MMRTYFTSEQESHEHSLRTLEALYEYDDFMESIGTVCDMGSGSGLDLGWWSTRTTRDERSAPLNIRCTGVDLTVEPGQVVRHRNTGFICHDFEQPIVDLRHHYDVIWCHDAFQYALRPLDTLRNWRSMMNANGMLVLILPQYTNIEYNTQAFDQRDHVYYNWTLVSLMHALAVSGFDCRDGFFLKQSDDPWLHAIVYRSEHLPQDPRTTTWLDLAELDLLPESAVQSYQRHGQVRQRDLVLPWLDRALRNYDQQ